RGGPEDAKSIEAEVISQLSDIVCPALIGPGGVVGAVPVARSVRSDEPDTLALGRVCFRREQVTRSWRSVECHDRQTVELAVLLPGELATINELEQLRITHPSHVAPSAPPLASVLRSEEHTSELQSL